VLPRSFLALISALLYAATAGKVQKFKLLMKEGADIKARNDRGSTLLMSASSKNGSLEIVQEILNKNVDVNETSNNGGTALVRAASWGKLDIVIQLLKKDADVNAKNNDRDTALMCASANGYLNIVKKLLSEGANLFLKDKNGNTALDDATRRNKNDVVAFLKSVMNL
jgi:ankyrin repeat protein